ncbi:hypothetical protein BCR44DRAFT_30493 [Catenaria anguillulae PL171]|uniref:Uncharacterized protein n=1 Tax=Catenaria anguillulae PL171 TaxID=765915 RepID=A0A1Y2H6Z7_9FUNG|nr:hypothetical protein BCR44DRAFT_30493 [Catenaria anguillulae PL171]
MADVGQLSHPLVSPVFGSAIWIQYRPLVPFIAAHLISGTRLSATLTISTQPTRITYTRTYHNAMDNHLISSSTAASTAGTAAADDRVIRTSPLTATTTVPTPPPSDGEYKHLDTIRLHESVENDYQTARIALDTALQRALTACHVAAESARSQHLVMWDVAMQELECRVAGCQALENDIGVIHLATGTPDERTRNLTCSPESHAMHSTETHKQQLDHFINSLHQACQFLAQTKSTTGRITQEQ